MNNTSVNIRSIRSLPQEAILNFTLIFRILAAIVPRHFIQQPMITHVVVDKDHIASCSLVVASVTDRGGI